MRQLRRLTLLLAILLGVGALLVEPSTARAAVERPRMLPSSQPALAAEPILPHVLYLPGNAAARGPLQVVVALHGMGGDGSTISGPLQAYAEEYGWLLVAPTIVYGDWKDPEQVRRDDTYFLPRLKALVDGLPSLTGLETRPPALLYGFSRGGQTAHRFASFYPTSVLGVASFSCGSYTLPYTRPPAGKNFSLAFPYGVADVQRYTGQPFDLDGFRQIRFLIGVGARDTQSGDLPRQWDHLGTNRVERAWAYFQALESLGVQARVAMFPDGIHFESDEMRRSAMEFLAGLTR